MADVPLHWPPLDNEQEEAGSCARSARGVVRGTSQDGLHGGITHGIAYGGEAAHPPLSPNHSPPGPNACSLCL